MPYKKTGMQSEIVEESDNKQEESDNEQEENDTILNPNSATHVPNKSRIFMLNLQFWLYHMAIKGPSFSTAEHWLWDTGKLAEFFTIIERFEMEYIKGVQKILKLLLQVDCNRANV